MEFTHNPTFREFSACRMCETGRGLGRGAPWGEVPRGAAQAQVKDQRQVRERHSRPLEQAAPRDFLFWHLPSLRPQPQYWVLAQCESLLHRQLPVGLM